MSIIGEDIAGYREKLRDVAKYQRWVILSLLLNIAFLIFVLVVTFTQIDIPSGPIIIRSLRIASIAFQIASIVMLARQFSNQFVTFLVAVAMFMPLISLIVLLVYNQRATGYLRQGGIQVGFFGVNPDSI